MAKASGSIVFAGLPAYRSRITIDDGQGNGHSQVTFTLGNTVGSSTTHNPFAGSTNADFQVNGNASKMVPIYRNRTTNANHVAYLYLNFNNHSQDKTFWNDVSTGGSTPAILEFKDYDGNTVNITFVNTASHTDGTAVSGATAARKASAGEYELNTNGLNASSATAANSQVTNDILAIIKAARDASEFSAHASTFVRTVSTYYLQIGADANGESNAPFSVRIKRASGSWTTTAKNFFWAHLSTGTAVGNVMAKIGTHDEPVYSIQNGSTNADIDSGSTASTARGTAMAAYLADIINSMPIQITATASGTTLSLENDNHGTAGNTTITSTDGDATTAVTTNITITSFSGGTAESGGGGGGGGGSEVARRSTISADQLALSASGGLASSSDNKSSIKLDLSGSLAALGASPDSADFLAVADATSGAVTKITVAELIGSVAAGSDTQVQFNDGGSSLGGDSGLTYDKTTDTLTIGNDLKLASDSAVLNFGADNDVTLTHVADTALLLNSSRQLQFGDSGTYIHQSADGVLDLVSDSEIEINATTIDMNGAIDASSTITAAGRIIVDDATDATSTTDGSLQTDGGLSVAKDAVLGNDVKLLSDAAVLNFGADSDVNLTHVADTGLLLNSSRQLQFGDSGTYIHQSADGVLDLVSDTEIEINATTIDMNGAVDISSNLVVGGNLTVQGTTTTVDSTTINISSSFTFEGPADDHETTLHSGTPTADSTVFLPALSAGSYHLPALADAATDASAAVTAAEFALLDGGSSVGTTSVASGDGFMHNDGGTMKHTQIDKIADLFAGSGLSASSAVLSVDLAQVSAAVVDVANDSILIIDADDSDATKKESVADLATGMAGAGIGVSSGVLSLDIDELSALGGTGVAQGDHFVFSDDGTEKKITFSNLEDAIFGNVSGQAAIAAGGAISLDVSAITAQTEMTGDVADADEFMISDGGVLKRADFSVIRDAVFADVSGDAAVAAGGALTIQADAVESGMLNDNVISGQTELASDGLAAADEMMISDGGTLKKIGVDNLFKDGPGLLSAADISVSADHIMFLDGGATGDAKIESVADVVAGIASAGLQASSGQLSITSVEDHFMSSSSNAGKTFSLSQTPASNASVSVYINGIFQVQSGSHATIGAGDYSVSGTTVTLVDANVIDASDEVVVKYIQS